MLVKSYDKDLFSKYASINLISKDEIINCANMVQTVTDGHDWLNKIIERINVNPRAEKIGIYRFLNGDQFFILLMIFFIKHLMSFIILGWL